MTFFLVIDLVLQIFSFFSHIFRMFTMLNVVYDHFLTRKTQFFTLFMFSRTSDNTASLKYWGDQCMGGPPTSNFGGTVPPVPLGLRPWERRCTKNHLDFALSRFLNTPVHPSEPPCVFSCKGRFTQPVRRLQGVDLLPLVIERLLLITKYVYAYQ